MLRVAGRKWGSNKKSIVGVGIVRIVGRDGKLGPCSAKESVEPRFAVVVRGMYVVNKMIVTNNWNPSLVMPEGATDIQEAEDDHGVC